MTRLRCLDCQDGRHCHHRGYVPAGVILAATGGRDLADEECARWGQPPIPRPELR
jgi:hypothetical protein